MLFDGIFNYENFMSEAFLLNNKTNIWHSYRT